MLTRECRLCHRIGPAGFIETGSEQWECANDRACNRRRAQRSARMAVELAAAEDPAVTLTDEERRAIAALERLAKRWPRSLKLASMDGSLLVYRSGDAPDEVGEDGAVADLGSSIPNTGGGF